MNTQVPTFNYAAAIDKIKGRASKESEEADRAWAEREYTKLIAREEAREKRFKAFHNEFQRAISVLKQSLAKEDLSFDTFVLFDESIGFKVRDAVEDALIADPGLRQFVYIEVSHTEYDKDMHLSRRVVDKRASHDLFPYSITPFDISKGYRVYLTYNCKHASQKKEDYAQPKMNIWQEIFLFLESRDKAKE